MSKRAEEYAVKIHDTAIKEGEKYAKSHGGSIIEEICYGWGFKAGAIKGYESAEKDLALSWEDIWTIVHTYLEVDRETKEDRDPILFCEETLRRFNETREKKG